MVRLYNNVDHSLLPSAFNLFRLHKEKDKDKNSYGEADGIAKSVWWYAAQTFFFCNKEKTTGNHCHKHGRNERE